LRGGCVCVRPMSGGGSCPHWGLGGVSLWVTPPLFPQLGPWLAVEIPDLVAKGIIQHKEK
ncbi:UFC1 enzyme, partial [Cepphus grylle]|nr:UFC1 enzyme [Cepphus grylle]